MRTNTKQIGFTLIELLVTIALFSVLATFAIPSYQNMIENGKVRTVTNSILTGLQIARAEAVKRNTKVQFDFRTGSAWTVCVAPAAPGSCPSTDDATTIQSRGVGQGGTGHVTITETAGGAAASGPYVFNGFGGMTSPATAMTINVGNSALAGSRDLRVVVGVGGSVKSCDPALTDADDPRRC